VAERLGSVRRRLIAVVAVAVLVAAAAYLFVLRGKSVTPNLVSSRPVAAIGSGSSAVAVAGDGTVLAWLPAPKEGSLPKLPLEALPKGPRVQGTVLEQAKVLAATPAALRPYVEGSYYGESGVDVKLTSGVELRFGNAGQAARKWQAAAAVLADPSVTAPDYVDLHTPGRPATGGSGHTLPPIP
jgi:Cell division protein FtsQ/DivIB, C-terminal